jgi:hypothetical protein
MQCGHQTRRGNDQTGKKPMKHLMPLRNHDRQKGLLAVWPTSAFRILL